MTDEHDTVDHHGPMSPAEFLYAIATAMDWPIEDEDDPDYIDEDAYRGDR